MNGVLGKFRQRTPLENGLIAVLHHDATANVEIAIRLLLPAGIVLSIDVVELHWRYAMDLHDDLAACHGEVVHVGIEIGEAAGGKAHHAALIEAVAHANLEGS